MKIGDLVKLRGCSTIAIVVAIDTNDTECEVMYYGNGKMNYTWLVLSCAEKRRIK